MKGREGIKKEIPSTSKTVNFRLQSWKDLGENQESSDVEFGDEQSLLADAFDSKHTKESGFVSLPYAKMKKYAGNAINKKRHRIKLFNPLSSSSSSSELLGGQETYDKNYEYIKKKVINENISRSQPSQDIDLPKGEYQYIVKNKTGFVARPSQEQIGMQSKVNSNVLRSEKSKPSSAQMEATQYNAKKKVPTKKLTSNPGQRIQYQPGRPVSRNQLTSNPGQRIKYQPGRPVSRNQLTPNPGQRIKYQPGRPVSRNQLTPNPGHMVSQQSERPVSRNQLTPNPGHMVSQQSERPVSRNQLTPDSVQGGISMQPRKKIEKTKLKQILEARTERRNALSHSGKEEKRLSNNDKGRSPNWTQFGII